MLLTMHPAKKLCGDCQERRKDVGVGVDRYPMDLSYRSVRKIYTNYPILVIPHKLRDSSLTSGRLCKIQSLIVLRQLGYSK